MQIRLLFDVKIGRTLVIPAGEVFETVRIFKKESHPGIDPPLTFDATRLAPDLVEVIARPGEYTTDSETPLAELQARNIRSQIRTGYKAWIAEPKREHSGEVDSGGYWSLSGDTRGALHRWSVSWIEDTGELYARNEADDEYIVLATTKPGDDHAADVLLEGWASPESTIYENLQVLYDRIRHVMRNRRPEGGA